MGLPSCHFLAYLSSSRLSSRQALARMPAFKVESATAENREARKGIFSLDSSGWNPSPGSDHARPRCAADQAVKTCLSAGWRMWVCMGGVQREFSDPVLVATSIIELNSLNYYF